MSLIRKALQSTVNFFSTKAGKLIAKIMAALGLTAAVAGAGEVAVAHKKNKRAEKIKNAAIEKHNESREKTEKVLSKLGEEKMVVYQEFRDLSDMIECIQQRPDFDFTVEGIDLPAFEPTEFKKLSGFAELAAGGLGGTAAGSAVGLALMGSGSLAALAPGALLGGFVICAMGAKMIHRAAEKVKQAKQIEMDVEIILEFYKQLRKEANSFYDSFHKVHETFIRHFNKVEKIVARKVNWGTFSKTEKLKVENAIKLAQLLNYMCAVELVVKAESETEVEQVNSEELEKIKSDAKIVVEKIKKDKAA